MKIAFSAYGGNWRDKVDIRFGRAAVFFVVDTDSGETNVIDNASNVDAAQGAGTNSARTIVDAGVDVLVTGNIGPKASAVLKAAGMKVMQGAGYTTIEEAYTRYKRGVLYENHL